MIDELLVETSRGLYCPDGDFYVDPWRPAKRAIITHAHADYARSGCDQYLAADSNRHLFPVRLGNTSSFQFQQLGKPISVGDVKVTFHPAGHVLGSAQIKIEKNGFSVVVSGDYKRQPDPTCVPFEPVRCNVFVTESTLGLPVFRWPDPESVFAQINSWWKQNQQLGKASLLLAYSLGKAQRLLAGIDSSIGPIYTHGAVEKLDDAYRRSGISLTETQLVGDVDEKQTDWSQSLIIAPPAAAGSTWTKRFGKLSTAMASGWLFEECYQRVGDLAETISLVLPQVKSQYSSSLQFLIERQLLPVRDAEPEIQKALVLELWSQLNQQQKFVFGKLLTGGFRVGVSQKLVVRAIAELTSIPTATIAHRLMGPWEPNAGFYETLIDPNHQETPISQPYPFFLANPLSDGPVRFPRINRWRHDKKPADADRLTTIVEMISDA